MGSGKTYDLKAAYAADTAADSGSLFQAYLKLPARQIPVIRAAALPEFDLKLPTRQTPKHEDHSGSGYSLKLPTRQTPVMFSQKHLFFPCVMSFFGVYGTLS